MTLTRCMPYSLQMELVGVVYVAAIFFFMLVLLQRGIIRDNVSLSASGFRCCSGIVYVYRDW